MCRPTEGASAQLCCRQGPRHGAQRKPPWSFCARTWSRRQGTRWQDGSRGCVPAPAGGNRRLPAPAAWHSSTASGQRPDCCSVGPQESLALATSPVERTRKARLCLLTPCRIGQPGPGTCKTEQSAAQAAAGRHSCWGLAGKNLVHLLPCKEHVLT